MSGRKSKAIQVLETEGYGIAQERNGSKIEQPLCRFKFPRFPLDKTEVLYALAVNIKFYFSKFLLLHFKDDDEGTNAKNLSKIKKYLIRQHFLDPKFKDPEMLKKRFKTLQFKDVLKDLNLSRSEYLNALRMTVQGKYTVFHERKPANLHINAYNPALLLLNGSNMDMTWISGKYFIFN